MTTHKRGNSISTEQKRNERRSDPTSTSPPELLAHGYSPLLLRFLQALLLALLRLHRLGVPHGLRGLLLQFRLDPQPLRHGILFFIVSSLSKQRPRRKESMRVDIERWGDNNNNETTNIKCTAVGIEEHSKKTNGRNSATAASGSRRMLFQAVAKYATRLQYPPSPVVFTGTSAKKTFKNFDETRNSRDYGVFDSSR